MTPWLDIAKGEIGTAEVKGVKNNPKIMEYHKSTLLKATSDEVPWCAAFVGWCLMSAGVKSTLSAVARSYLSLGKVLKDPEIGCIVILRRGSSKWQGHVGFYMGSLGQGTIEVLGGNQGDKVSIQTFLKEKVLGYRMPSKKVGEHGSP